MRVLVVKLTSMGDLVQALPALSDAHQMRPDIIFDWVVDESFAEVPGWHPAVDRIIKTAHRRWKSKLLHTATRGQLQSFIGELRQYRYDAVIDAQSNLKSAVVTALARGPKHGLDRHSVREFSAHWAYRHHYAIPKEQLAIARWRQLFAQTLHYALPDTPPDFGLAINAWPAVDKKSAADKKSTSDKKYIVAVPNASWDNKYWSDSHWREVIATARASGLDVLLTSGSEKEQQRCAQIADGLDNARVLPRMTLTEVAAILLKSAGAICMDTGLAHVAAALNIPTLTLYGPTDPNLIGATGANSHHLLASGYDCIPCYRRECSVIGYRGTEAQCLKKITAEQVWKMFLKL